MKFLTLEDQLICSECADRMVRDTIAGRLTGDEVVMSEMLIPAGEHGQCDNCGEQCDDYPDCEYRNV